MKHPTWVPESGETIFFWSDLKAVIRRVWWRMLLYAVAGFTCGAAGYTYWGDFEYAAKATYRLQAERLEVRNPLVDMILGSSGSNGDPGPFLQSRTICEPVVKRLGLQVEAQRKDDWLERIRHWIRWACRKRIPDPASSRFSDVVYTGEEPLVFQLERLDGDRFVVAGQEGQLGVPFATAWGQFTAEACASGSFAVSPLLEVVEEVAEQIELKSIGSEIFELEYRHRDRHRAVAILNALIEEFQGFQKRNHDELSRAQLALLEEREQQLANEFNEVLRVQIGEGFTLEQQVEEILKQREEMQTRGEALEEQLYTLEMWDREQSLVDNALGQQINPLIAQIHELRRERALLSSLDHGRRFAAEHQLRREGAEEALRKYELVLREMERPEFPLGTLSALLPDSASAALIARTAQIQQQLFDPTIYTEKERERMRDEAQLNRRLLADRIRQLIGTERLSVQLTRETLCEVQHALKGSLDRQIALLQEQVEALTQGKQAHLIREREWLAARLAALQERIRQLPEQLRREQMLRLKIEGCTKSIETLAREVESRRVEQQLHHLSSKPFDWAVPPLHPVSPPFFLVSGLCGCFGLFAPLFAGLIRGLRRGFPVSAEKLQILRYPYAGRIRSREAMQRIALFADRSKRIGLILGQGPAYQTQLEHELQRLGITFQVLIWNPEVRSLQELVFLSEQAPVSMTIIALRAPLISPAAESLLRVVDRAVVTVVDEPLEDLTPYMKWGYDLSFARVAYLTP